MEDIWIEKYRPKTLDEVVGQTEIVARLKAYVKERNIPHLLFAGPAGTGKTTCAIVLARELFGEDWQRSFIELNASDERGIDVVRGKIKEYARTSAPNSIGFKIIFLDEADALTAEAQAALRRTMERFSKTCRFILSCNFSSKIIEPIQSRCAVFRFRPISNEEIKKRLRYIAEMEDKIVTEDALDAITYIAEGDMRKAINLLQISAAITEKIDENTVYKASGTAKKEDIEKMIKLAIEGKFFDSRKVLDELFLEYGLSGVDIIKHIHREIYDLSIPDIYKVMLLDKTGEIEFRLVEGSSEKIQLDALLAHITLLGKRMREGGEIDG